MIRQRLAASPVLLVLISVVSVQLGSSLAKDLYAHATPLGVAWLRLVFAALILGALTRPKIRDRSLPEWREVVGYGLAMAAMNATFYLSIQRIPIGMAVTFEFLGPLTLAVLGSRRARDLLWVVLAGVGVATLGFSPGELDPIGVGLALLAGTFWALYIVMAARVGRHWSGVTGVTVATWVGAVGLTVPLLILGQVPGPQPRVWAMGAVVALLASVISYGLEMVALRRLPKGVFGILMSTEPAAAALAAWMILGEALRPIEWLAMAAVIAASVGATRSGQAQPTKA